MLGAFALSENNLYTTDAFTDYLSHLTDDGLLAFTRWGFDPPRESLRLLSLAMAALPRVGETDPARHVIVVREDTAKLQGWGALDTVLVSRKPFTAADIANAREIIARNHWDEIYLPGDIPKNPFGQLLTAPDPVAFWRDYPFDVSPVSDDRPFFFYTVQPRDLWRYITTASESSADFKVQKAVPLLFGLMAVSLCATALILLLPRFLLGTRLPKQKGVITFLWYFICLGAGYILIQVALIQKFVLLLGHPTYALVVIVFSMLVASGVGSYFSRSIIADEDARLVRVLCAIAVLVTAPRIHRAAPYPNRRGLAAACENAHHRSGDRARGLPDGHAVSERSEKTRAKAPAVNSLGLVAQRSRERARIRGGNFPRDLHRPSGDTVGWRRALPLRPRSHRSNEYYSPACLSKRVASST